MVVDPTLLLVALHTPNSTMPPTPPPAPQIDRKETEHQLATLFGESLVGPWPDLGPNLERTGNVRRGRAWLWRLGALVLAVAVVFGARALVRPGLDRRSAEDRSQYAERLRMSLQDGHVEDAAALVDLVRGQNPELDPSDPHFEQLLRAEAAVYRYFDAKPQRLARIWPHLRGDSPTPMSASRLVARYTVVSREEREQHLADLERLRGLLPDDAEVHYLIASAREHEGNVTATREAYGRSEALGPAWLNHRFDQLEFERKQGDSPAAAKTAQGMLRSDPSSPWSRFAALLSGIPVPPLGTDAAVPASFPVQIFRVKLIQAAQAASHGDSFQAERLMTAAVTAIHGEPPFMIDAFDYLLERESQTLAQGLTETKQWPKDSAIAAAKQQQLAKAPLER